MIIIYYLPTKLYYNTLDIIMLLLPLRNIVQDFMDCGEQFWTD